MFSRIRVYVAAILMLASLACGVVTSNPPQTEDPAKVALQVQLTVMAMQQATLAAQGNQGGQQPQPTPQPLPTYTPFPTYTPPSQPSPQPPSIGGGPTATPSQDINTRMNSAKILVFEDTWEVVMWVKKTLDSMGLKYTHVADRSGDFMAEMNSGTDWDLIIVDAESKTKIQGEFWDLILKKVTLDKSALIASVWYLDQIGEGRIKPFLTECGITYQRDLNRPTSIYWLEPKSPVFNDPNILRPLLNYSDFWNGMNGDLIKLIPGSKAILLAGTEPNESTSYGQIASCFDGRVIYESFSDHNYRQAEIQLLYKNYITNVLKARFAIKP